VWSIKPTFAFFINSSKLLLYNSNLFTFLIELSVFCSAYSSGTSKRPNHFLWRVCSAARFSGRFGRYGLSALWDFWALRPGPIDNSAFSYRPGARAISSSCTIDAIWDIGLQMHKHAPRSSRGHNQHSRYRRV